MKVVRKAIPQKMKMLLQREIGSECPLCGSRDVDHFQFHHIDENPSHNEAENIIMLCPMCHSKITKGDIAMSDVERMKQKLQSEAGGKPMSAKIINFNSKIGNAIIEDNTKVTINIGKDRSLYHVPESKFDELVAHMKARIDNTKLGRIKGAKGQDNYSNFEKYIKENSGDGSCLAD